MRSTRITDVIHNDFEVIGDAVRNISGVVYDSRMVKGGELFVAVRGEKLDGWNFIEDAIKKGAVAVMYENKGPLPADLYMTMEKKYPEVTWIRVADIRDALARVAQRFYGCPSGEIVVIGITGTNGKTTTSYIIRSILARWGEEVGIIGTINYLIKDAVYEARHTTPEAPDFQCLLREMREAGCGFVVSEVSSHALVMKRADYTRFKVAVFTNLTRDHLDFHTTMEEYFRAKERLFTELLNDDGIAVINVDDAHGMQLARILRNRKPSVKVITYALVNKDADVTAFDIKTSYEGTSFKTRSGEDETEIMSQMVGQTNVYNMLAALCAALALNVPIKVIKEGIAMAGLVKGRFEKVDMGQDFLAVVDYAHTEDALERLLMTARQLLEAYRFVGKTEKIMKEKRRQFAIPKRQEQEQGKGKIITVLGCGGNRDKGKRSKMGEIASRLSDFVIITSDNPRSENPKTIIKDIEKGIKGDSYIVIPDRNVAISMAVELASSGEIVLVAGKGHEEYQEIQGIRRSFSDRTALENAIKRTITRPAFGGGSTFAGLYAHDQSKRECSC
ncbi:MAG TPA: UDP-N-acetylmuramoyl-L-alanyl-D-glutamate--2,6-diaminopimelate ligase [Dissulfurispiraceae bacterium]|nr:UDP-N-acetylmuramoyl-L-alanyl-D-glutamate--2,6-diaminopimelate ligase [Dissulfurispiraceae bacterium]